MSPTVLRFGEYRFYFFSREESRAHIHVQHAAGEAKIWLTPHIRVAAYHGLSRGRLLEAVRLVQEHHDEITAAWHAYFGS